MYCPACGKVNATDQRFCRACGLSLESIVKSFQEAKPTHDIEQLIKDKTRNVDRLLVGIGGTTATLFLAFLLWSIIYKLIILKGEVFKGSAIIAFILGAVSVGILVIYRDALEKQAKAQKGPVELPKGSDTSHLLESPPFEPVSSVTDRTTELLKVQRGNRVTAPTDSDQI